MKKTITLLVALVLAISLHAQKGSFVKNYLKLRQPTEENFAVQTFEGKELKHWVDSLKSETTEEAQEGRRLLEKVKEMTVIMDGEEQSSSDQLGKLLQPYEELTSMEVKQTLITIRGVMQKDKIKELLVLVENKDERFLSMVLGYSLIVVDMIFKKPITLEELGGFEGVSKFVSINGSDDEKSKSFMDLDVNVEGNWKSLPNIKKIEVAKENGLYGVKHFSSNGEESHFMIQPQYKNEIIIYRSKTFNSDAYVKIKTDDGTANLLYDQFGFQIAEAKDVTPVYMPDSELVVYFIVDKGGLYSLYECPEVYKQQQEYGNGPISAHINYRIEDCQSIKLMDNHTLECKKTDGSVEVITIEKK